MSPGYLFPGHAWAFCCIFVNIPRNSHLDLTTVFLICYVRVLPLNQFVRNQALLGAAPTAKSDLWTTSGCSLGSTRKGHAQFCQSLSRRMSKNGCLPKEQVFKHDMHKPLFSDWGSPTQIPPKGIADKGKDIAEIRFTDRGSEHQHPPKLRRIWGQNLARIPMSISSS